MPQKRKLSHNSNSIFQQNFTIQNAIKRNKRYLDLSRINKANHQYEVIRRRPFSSSEKSVDQKINSSFMNTTAAFSDKVEQQIGKFKLRMNCITSTDQFVLDESLKSERPLTQRSLCDLDSRLLNNSAQERSQKKKIRGMALDKYCSRQQYYRSRNKLVLDERLFNNYRQQKPDLSHTRNFDHYLERNLDLSHKNFHQLEYSTQKLYEDYYYKKTTLKCNLDYKTQKKTPRIFFAKKSEEQPATDLSPKNIQASFEKCTMLKHSPIDSFYANSGKQLPSQLDMRFNTNLTNQWVDGQGKVVRKLKEYSLRKMKNDLIEAKMQQLKNKKIPQFSRNDLCDQKYFLVHPPPN